MLLKVPRGPGARQRLHRNKRSLHLLRFLRELAACSAQLGTLLLRRLVERQVGRTAARTSEQGRRVDQRAV